MTIQRKRSLLSLDTSLRETPQIWLRYIEPNITRQGFLPCWIWCAGLGVDGKPLLTYNGKSTRARALIASLFYDWTNKRIYIKMSCRNESCVNPQHLILSEARFDKGGRNKAGRPSVINPYLYTGAL